eukprot:6002910-Pleurochrysis_carterae.AAC.1
MRRKWRARGRVAAEERVRVHLRRAIAERVRVRRSGRRVGGEPVGAQTTRAKSVDAKSVGAKSVGIEPVRADRLAAEPDAIRVRAICAPTPSTGAAAIVLWAEPAFVLVDHDAVVVVGIGRVTTAQSVASRNAPVIHPTLCPMSPYSAVPQSVATAAAIPRCS